MANLVVHFEIHASEPQKLIDFYSALLGWTFQDYGGGEQPYWAIDTGEGAIGNVAGPGGPRHQRRSDSAPGPTSGGRCAGQRLQHRRRRRRRRRADAPRRRARRDRGAAGDRLAGHRPRRLPARSRRQRLRSHLAGPLRRHGSDGRRRGGVGIAFSDQHRGGHVHAGVCPQRPMGATSRIPTD